MRVCVCVGGECEMVQLPQSHISYQFSLIQLARVWNQLVAHSMPGVPLQLRSVGVSQATTAAAPVQVQPAEVPPATPIGFKIVNVVVKSSIQ